MKNKINIIFLTLLTSLNCMAVESTLQNDSLVDLSSGAIQSGFVANESAAVWLDSPCDGDIRAIHIFWRSLTGGAPTSIEAGITISEEGAFPIPGSTLVSIVGTVLTDGVFNEYRFLDENSVIPLIVPVLENETFVVSFTFENTPGLSGASLVTDVDGCQANRNALFSIPPSTWFDSCLLGLSGDFVIRAVVDCPSIPSTVDLSVLQESMSQSYTPGQDLDYKITVSNAGPSAANAATLIDFFPTELSSIDWMCSPMGGAACTSTSGTGNLTESINLPANGSLIFDVVGEVNISTTGVLSNSAQVVVPAGLTDTNPNNNSITFDLSASDDLIFADGFE